MDRLINFSRSPNLCSKCLISPPAVKLWGYSCFASDSVSTWGLVLHLGLGLAPQGLCVLFESWYRWMGGHVLLLNSTPPSSHSLINGLLVDKSPLRLREGGQLGRQWLLDNQCHKDSVSTFWVKAVFSELSISLSFIFIWDLCVCLCLSVSSTNPTLY